MSFVASATAGGACLPAEVGLKLLDKQGHDTPTVIGITGGIGAGKSTVAGMMGELGAEVIDADSLAHEALKLDGVRRAIREEWGPEVFRSNGQVDCVKLAEAAFGDAENVQRLEAIIHPLVKERIRQRIGHSTADNVVIDAPLLTESGLHELCDVIVFVQAPDAERRARVKARGWSDEELPKREAMQQSLSEKSKCSQYVIENEHSLSTTQEQVVQFWYDRIK